MPGGPLLMAPPSSRSTAVRAAVAVGLALLLAVLLTAPLPAYVVRPGPAFGLADQITVPGGEPISGDYLFTTIQVEDATVAAALGAAVDVDAQVVSRQQILGGESEEAFLAHQLELFQETEALAVRLGLTAVDSSVDPASVEVEGEGVGGPSAGLLTALAVADLADPADLAAGRLVSGTGAVARDGTVRPVGSVADKIAGAEAAGAEVFLVPAEQLPEAQATGTDMRLIGVSSLREAIAALAA
jgi:PDZ domain-containing protein